MAFAPDHISRRLKQRGLIAVALVVALTGAATLLAAAGPDTGLETSSAPATASPSILAPQPAVAANRDPDVAGRRSTLAAVTSWRDMRLAPSPAAVAASGADLVAIDPNLIDALPASDVSGPSRRRRLSPRRCCFCRPSSTGYRSGRPPRSGGRAR